MPEVHAFCFPYDCEPAREKRNLPRWVDMDDRRRFNGISLQVWSKEQNDFALLIQLLVHDKDHLPARERMKTEFTLRELMNARPCWKEFAKLMAYIEIDIRSKEVQTYSTPTGGLYVAIAHFQEKAFSAEELDTVISADAVANATNDEEVANKNLTWCWVTDLLSEKMVAKTTTRFVAVYTDEKDKNPLEAEETASDDFEMAFARTHRMARNWKSCKDGRSLDFSEDRKEIWLLENGEFTGMLTITKKTLTTAVCEATQEEEK